jgi:hypothetical protein
MSNLAWAYFKFCLQDLSGAEPRDQECPSSSVHYQPRPRAFFSFEESNFACNRRCEIATSQSVAAAENVDWEASPLMVMCLKGASNGTWIRCFYAIYVLHKNEKVLGLNALVSCHIGTACGHAVSEITAHSECLIKK